jgi:hypothetical protein
MVKKGCKSNHTTGNFGGAGGMEGMRQRMARKKPLKPFPTMEDAMKQARKGS